MRCTKGFTLIEVMVVVAIIAILAAIAIPNYADYVSRSRITEAISDLSDLRVRMEQYFQDNRTYVGFTDGRMRQLDTCAVSTTVPGKYFEYSCGVPTATSYTFTATGINPGPMNGFVFTVDQANSRTTSVPTGWVPSTTCWVLKKDGSC
jgi:type IV pilus assembly protein PilE